MSSYFVMGWLFIAQEENLRVAGRAELLLFPEFMGGAAAPPYRKPRKCGGKWRRGGK